MMILIAKVCRGFKNQYRYSCGAFILLGWLLLTGSSLGEDHRWIRGTGGAFEVNDNWNPRSVPGFDDRAIFDLPNSYSVTFNGSHDNDQLLVRNGVVSYQLNGNSYNLLFATLSDPIQSASMVIGLDSGDTAITSLIGGTLSSAHSVLGWNTDSLGILQVRSGAVWNNRQTAIIGLDGEGGVLIAEGGQANIFDAQIGRRSGQGQVVVTGNGSSINAGFLSVGHFGGNGELSIINRGAAEIAEELYIGVSNSANLTSVGQVTISGVGSQIISQGRVSVGTSNATGQVSVNSGGQLIANSSLYLGSLDSTSGGVSSNGIASVSGVGSLVDIAENVIVGAVNPTGLGQLQALSRGSIRIGHTLRIAQGTGTVTIDGGEIRTRNFTNQSGTLQFDDGSLIIEGGLFSPLTSPGVFEVNGLADSDRPVLILNNGASTENTQQLNIGSSRHGELAILRGSTLIAQNVQLGVGIESFGLTRVEGTASRLNSDQLSVGMKGQGELRVSQGGQVRILNGEIGRIGSELDQSIGLVQVEGDGSRLVADFGIILGQRFATGTLNIVDGGRVETGSIFIGGNDVATHQNADGQVNVAGVGSVLKTNGNLVVGSPVSSIVGNLMISDRGTVDVGQTLTNMAGTGTITLSGGRIVASSIDHYHQMGFSSSNNSLFGQVTLHSGSLVHANQESETTFWGDVNIQTGVSLAGDGMVDFRGTLNIGNSPGIQEFGFNVGLLSSSTLRVEIGGIDISVPEYDQYIFLQDLELSSGTLLVELIGLSDPSLPYLPSLGDQFNIFQVDGVLTGTFGTIALPSLTEGLAWDVSQLYSHGQLSVVNAVPEPSSALTVLLVGLGLISHRRRKGNTAH